MSKLAHRPICPYCEGRGLLYDGAPDAQGTTAYACDVCHGTGRDLEHERMVREHDEMIFQGLRR